MSSVRKRKLASGETAWLVTYTVKDKGGKKGLRRFKQFEKKKDAEAYRIKVEGEVKTGIHVPDSESVTVAEAAKLWVEHVRNEGREAGTLKQYAEHVRLHIVPLLGTIKLSKLTAPMVEAFRDELLRTRSRQMSRKIIVSLKSILKEAKRRGLVGHNAASETKVATQSRQKTKVKIPSKQELGSFLSKSAELWGQTRIEVWHPFVITAIFTGFRLSELRGLTWCAVDLDNARISVKQRADYRGVLGVPKSETGEREIPLAPMALKRWKLACPQTSQNLVFPYKGEIASSSVIHKQCWSPLLRALGLKERYTFHSLRHVAASLLIERGWTAKRVQQFMGHASIQITFDTYGHLWPDHENDQEAMKGVEAALGL
jgi:integrase